METIYTMHKCTVLNSVQCTERVRQFDKLALKESTRFTDKTSVINSSFLWVTPATENLNNNPENQILVLENPNCYPENHHPNHSLEMKLTVTPWILILMNWPENCSSTFCRKSWATHNININMLNNTHIYTLNNNDLDLFSVQVLDHMHQYYEHIPPFYQHLSLAWPQPKLNL